MNTHQHPEASPSRSAVSPYAAFLSARGEAAPASAYEQWAAEHPGGTDEALAWLDAGWARVQEGDDERALRVFRRAVELGGARGREAQAAVVRQLYALKRPEEAEQLTGRLADELATQPTGVDDLHVYDAMVEVLSESDRPEQALGWCLAGLEAATRLPEDEQVSALRRGLQVSRISLNETLGLEPDAEDQALEAELSEELRAFGSTLNQLLDHESGTRKLDVPDGGEAFDGLVLRWARADFPSVRARWPETTALYGDDYDFYAARIQREARAYAEAGATRVLLTTGTLTDYLAYAERTGVDPALPATRQAYGEWKAVRARQDTIVWPPARNGPCWCDSGRKYKKCCGTPADK
ncbi:SEC-C domain-containing protein [Streptomyces sp. PSKA54]|uniref:SEC-C domain-containing protein n=1 Tax=Streptomyces himalayensis subsp. aureolus TaxID=2758039 RepID=A0A7W2HIY4_9ACTN|nr:SEC-C domain-containing protein [Streptomyces himalayensis]MBA4865304.1 SEC-C domain-containing protein [Streptomyces himalayensis subsp. aureolus]